MDLKVSTIKNYSKQKDEKDTKLEGKKSNDPWIKAQNSFEWIQTSSTPLNCAESLKS